MNTDDESSFIKRVEDIRKQRERLEAVLRSLPVPPECEQPIKDDLGYLNREEHIRAYAENLSLVAESDYAVPRGDKASIRALDTLSKHLAKVRETFAALPLEAEGGSQSDDWNNVLTNQTLNTVWFAHSNDEFQERQRNATAAALVGIGPRDETGRHDGRAACSLPTTPRWSATAAP